MLVAGMPSEVLRSLKKGTPLYETTNGADAIVLVALATVDDPASAKASLELENDFLFSLLVDACKKAHKNLLELWADPIMQEGPPLADISPQLIMAKALLDAGGNDALTRVLQALDPTTVGGLVSSPKDYAMALFQALGGVERAPPVERVVEQLRSCHKNLLELWADPIMQEGPPLGDISPQLIMTKAQELAGPAVRPVLDKLGPADVAGLVSSPKDYAEALFQALGLVDGAPSAKQVLNVCRMASKTAASSPPPVPRCEFFIFFW